MNTWQPAARNLLTAVAGSVGAGAAVSLTVTGGRFLTIANHGAAAIRLRPAAAYAAATGVTIPAGQTLQLVPIAGSSAWSVQNDGGAAVNYAALLYS